MRMRGWGFLGLLLVLAGCGTQGGPTPSAAPLRWGAVSQGSVVVAETEAGITIPTPTQSVVYRGPSTAVSHTAVRVGAVVNPGAVLMSLKDGGTVVAPIGGRVVRLASVGHTLGPTQNAAVIQPTSQRTVAVTLPHTLQADWRAGTAVAVADGDIALHGSVKKLGPAPGRDLVALCVFPDAAKAPVMPSHPNVTAKLYTVKGVLRVPAGAIVQGAGQSTVVQTPGGSIPVAVIAATPTLVAVKGNLHPGEAVRLPRTLGSASLTRTNL